MEKNTIYRHMFRYKLYKFKQHILTVQRNCKWTIKLIDVRFDSNCTCIFKQHISKELEIMGIECNRLT